MDERLQIVFARRSIRQYTDQPVSEADITSLLEAGMAAPSAMNRRPWHLVAVSDKQVIQTIAAPLRDTEGNLDGETGRHIIELLFEINKQQGTTLVLVTHNVFQAKRLAHRTAFLLDGRLVEINDTPTFFENPADPRTAAFVRGDMVY